MRRSPSQNHRPLRRQRSEGGAVLMIVALGLTFLMAGTAFGVDHGRITNNRRNLQKVADLVALDASGHIDGRTTAEIRDEVEGAILVSAYRNGFVEDVTYTFTDGRATIGDEKAIDYTIGRYNTTAQQFSATTDPEVPNAVRVELTEGIGYFFQPGDSTSTKRATAMYLLPTGAPATTDGGTTDGGTTDGGTTDGGTAPHMSETFSIGSFVAAFERDTAQTNQALQFAHTKALILNTIWGRAFSRVDDAPPQPVSDESVEIPVGQLAIDVVGYQGLARTAVTLDELRAVLGFGTINELLQADITMATFFQGLIDALQLPKPPAVPPTGDGRIDNRLAALAEKAPEGSDLSVFDDPALTAVQPRADEGTTLAAVEALGQAKSKSIDSKTISLKQFLTVREGYDNSVAQAELNVMELVGSAALITGGSFFSTDVLVPINSPDAAVLELPTILQNRVTYLESRYSDDPQLLQTYTDLTTVYPSASELLLGRLSVAVIEPPDTASGPPGMENGVYFTFAETAQVRIGLTVHLLKVDLKDLLLLGGVDLLGLTSTVADLQLPLIITGGSASAGLATMDCIDVANGYPSAYDVTTNAMDFHIGRTENLSASTLEITDGEILTAEGSDVDLTITGRSYVNVAGSSQVLPVTADYNVYNTYRVTNPPTSDVGASLIANLDAKAPNLEVLLSPLGNTETVTGPTLDREVGELIERRVDQLDRQLERELLQTVTSSLGVSLAGADLTASDIECGTRVLVEDDA